jgi:hypothetical protein
MSRTFTVWSGGGAGGAIQSGDPATHVEAEYIRNAIDIAMYFGREFDLGGDERGMTITTPGTFQAVNGSRRLSHNGDNDGGLTLEAVVSYYTSDAATSVQVRVRNLTDSSNAATGTLSTATLRTDETLTLTLASGVKSYELQWDAGNTTNPVYAWGYIRLRKVPA